MDQVLPHPGATHADCRGARLQDTVAKRSHKMNTDMTTQRVGKTPTQGAAKRAPPVGPESARTPATSAVMREVQQDPAGGALRSTMRVMIMNDTLAAAIVWVVPEATALCARQRFPCAPGAQRSAASAASDDAPTSAAYGGTCTTSSVIPFTCTAAAPADSANRSPIGVQGDIRCSCAAWTRRRLRRLRHPALNPTASAVCQ